ncbi:unnamed protein product [Ectocarpus sp. 8 AP-2014]
MLLRSTASAARSMNHEIWRGIVKPCTLSPPNHCQWVLTHLLHGELTSLVGITSGLAELSGCP